MDLYPSAYIFFNFYNRYALIQECESKLIFNMLVPKAELREFNTEEMKYYRWYNNRVS